MKFPKFPTDKNPVEEMIYKYCTEIIENHLTDRFNAITNEINNLKKDFDNLNVSKFRIDFFDNIYPSISQRLSKLEHDISTTRKGNCWICKGKGSIY